MGSTRPEARRATSFDDLFRALSGLEGSAAAFPWQRALFAEFLAGRFPSSCDIPMGLRKTSVIAIWLLALARHARALIDVVVREWVGHLSADQGATYR